MNSARGVLVVVSLPERLLAQLSERYAVQYFPLGLREQELAALNPTGVQGVLTSGTRGFTSWQMDRLRELSIICCYGAGYENVDVAAACARGIGVANAQGVNDRTVADHAMALLLALARGVVAADKAVRGGEWAATRDARPEASRKRLGLIGMGRIGTRIASRAAAFEMTIGYHARRDRADVPYRYYGCVDELAAASDYLVAACPGGRETFHLVNADVLRALGPAGFLINVARGSVVDTRALIAALRERRIAGAALDVLENEPDVPAELTAMDNVIFTPHMAGRSPEAMQAQLELWMANFEACFAGGEPLTPVPAGGA